MADDTEVQQAAKERIEPTGMSVAEERDMLPGADLGEEEELASREPEPWALKQWRPLMFLIIFAIAVAVGFHYRSEASPGTEALKHKAVPPQTLNIYASNSGMPVQVVINISPNSAGQYVRDRVSLFVKSTSPHPHLKILIISSLRSPSFSPLVSARGTPYRHLYFKEFTLRQHNWSIWTPGPGNEYEFAAIFHHLPNILQESKGTIFGHLPSVQVANGGPTGYLLAQMTKKGSVKYVYYNPQTSESTAPSALPPGATPHEGPMVWFNSPQNLSISESISGALPLLRNAQIVYMTPPATLHQANYTWRANGELEPTFEATDPDAIDARNDASFTSGIAFGVAGAAAIALVQELPKDIPNPGSFPAWVRTLRLATWARRNKLRWKRKPSGSR